MTAIKKLTDSKRVFNVGPDAYLVSMDSQYPTWNDGDLDLDTKVDWEADPQSVLGKDIVPYGVHNRLPTVIRDLLEDNNLAPGIIDREIGLLYGKGPELYRKVYVDGEPQREYLNDPEVWDWFNTWDFKRYLDMAITEVKHMKGVFTRWYRNRGPRIGMPGDIVRLQVVPGTDARLGWPLSGGKRLEDVRVIYTGDFENNCIRTGIRSYPIFNPQDPFRYPVAMSYSNYYSFGRTFYAIPTVYSSRHWIQRSNDVVATIKYFQDNAINSAYHIQSPEGYWDGKRDEIVRDNNHKWDHDSKEVSNKLEELKEEVCGNIVKVLAGKKNAGKFVHTVSFYDDQGEKQEWKIEPVKQDLKEFIEAMLKISDKADSATTSGIGLHPGLSNIIVNGKFNSGSELLYALKLYMVSDTSIPEGIIFQEINKLLKIKWPDKDLRMGFYHPVVAKESEVNPENRTKENV